jgi:predicted transcriptional regulator
MGSSLFNLISRAGSMSVGELAARTSIEPFGLGQELAEMVRSGQVSLSRENPSSAGSTALHFVDSARSLPKEELAKALTEVVGDSSLAETVTIVPTTQGYRSAIS